MSRFRDPGDIGRWTTIILIVIAVSIVTSKITSSKIDSAQKADHAQRIAVGLAGCRRNKDNFVDIARVFTQLNHYYAEVSTAASVKADVHQLASDTEQIVGAAAGRLRSRLFLCVPLVVRNKLVPDQRVIALAERINVEHVKP